MKIRPLFFLALLLSACGSPSADLASWPREVAAGEPFKVSYDAHRSDIGPTDSLWVNAYIFGQGKVTSARILARRESHDFVTDLMLPPQATGALVWFEGSNGIGDINGGRGYQARVLDASGNAQPQYFADMAVAYAKAHPRSGLTVPNDTLVVWLETTMEANPSLLPRYIGVYDGLLNRLGSNREAKSVYETNLRVIFSEPDSLAKLDSEALIALHRLSSRNAIIQRYSDRLTAAINNLDPNAPAMLELLVEGSLKTDIDLEQSLILAASLRDQFNYTNASLSRHLILALAEMSDASSLDRFVDEWSESFDYDDFVALFSAAEPWPETNNRYHEIALETLHNRKGTPLNEGRLAAEVDGNAIDQQLCAILLRKAEIQAQLSRPEDAMQSLNRCLVLLPEGYRGLPDAYARIAENFGRPDVSALPLARLGELGFRPTQSAAAMQTNDHETSGLSASIFNGDRIEKRVRSRWLNIPISGEMAYLSIDDTLRLSDWSNKTVVLLFWNTRCRNCPAIMRGMSSMIQSYPASEVELVYVNALQWENDARLRVGRFLTDHSIPGHPLVMDRSHPWARAFSINAIPTVWVLDPKGVLRYRAFDEGRDPAWLAAEVETAVQRAR